MRNGSANARSISMLFILAVIFMNSCEKWDVSPELAGQWTTNRLLITVRTEPENGQFEFTSDSASISITICDDKTVTGFIGDAEFQNGVLKKEWGNIDITGVAYTIVCGSVGKIFENDPLDSKEVQLWLSPIKEEGIMKAELRYTEGGSHFPMADITFTKEIDQ